jgi:hypothetical protein
MFETNIVEKIKTHILLQFFLIRGFYDIMRKNKLEPGRSQMAT